MGEGKQEVFVANTPSRVLVEKTIKQIGLKYKELEVGFRSWMDQQSLPVEVAVTTVTSAAQGAIIGSIMGTLTSDLSFPTPTPPPGSSLDPKAMASLQQAQAFAGGPSVQARNFAVMTGTNAGISCLMRRLRGKEDIQSSMVAAFGSGVMFSLVSGVPAPNIATAAAMNGLGFAVVQGALYKVGERFSRPNPEDELYNNTRSMLSSLGLQSYEKNFKRGLLTDRTLPLLTDSALRDVKIPPGPRLLILDHIQSDPELKKGARRT